MIQEEIARHRWKEESGDHRKAPGRNFHYLLLQCSRCAARREERVRSRAFLPATAVGFEEVAR